MDIKMIGKAARNKLIQDLFSAFQRQLNLSEEEISKFRHEAFLVESNEEQILKWEKFMNLEEKPDYSLQDRIDRVLFTLQSRGSFTPEFLKEQAKIFMNGIIDVEELFNEYSFTVVFKDIVGVPPNLENFRAMLELNKPAHLTYKFKFRYNTHGQLEILTHGDMEQYTHDELYQKRVFDDSQLPEGTPILARALNKVKEVAKLIFPLKTDYYNVDIFNDNFRYLDEHKLEKGAVSAEYDTAKKIEDKIKAAQDTVNNKLDKGNVTAEYNTAEKIEAKIKVAQETAKNAGNTANIKLTKGNLPATIPDAKGIYDLLENNGGLNIDPNLLYLNDAGTKTAGKVYFDRNKKGMFECIQTTTTTTNSTTYFVDISNKASADRLANLFENPKKVITKYIIVNSTEQLFDLEIDMNNINFLVFYSFENSGYISRTPVTLITPKMLDKKLVSTISGSGREEPANFNILMYSFTKEGIFKISQSIQSSNGLREDNPIYLNIEIY